MGKITILFLGFFVYIVPLSLYAQDTDEIISIYEGSEVVFDDNIGFDEHHILSNDTLVEVIEGKIRRQFCLAPEGRSPYEIIKNYEKAISSKGGEIIHLTREADNWRQNNRFIRDLFTKERISRLNHYGYMKLPGSAKDYITGKISTAEVDFFIAVAATRADDKVYFTLVTVEAEPMDMDMVTLDAINDGIAQKGRIAIYDIYFDTGKSEVKEESSRALDVIASYLKQNKDKKYLVVGHTDNTGSFDKNIELSQHRAQAVADILTTEYEISEEQLLPYGIGSTSPVFSNTKEEGKARNRRVEIVEW